MGTRVDQNAWLRLWDTGHHLFSACPHLFGLSTAGIDETHYFPHKNVWEHLEESGLGIIEMDTHSISTFERHSPGKWHSPKNPYRTFSQQYLGHKRFVFLLCPLYGQGRETQIFSRKLGKKTRPLTIKVTVMKESIMEKPVGILACNKVLGQF